MTLRKTVKGYTLIFAIVVIIIITSVALLFLSYFQFNNYMLNSVEAAAIGRKHCMNGIAGINASAEYDKYYELDLKDGFHLYLHKIKWGAFDVCYSCARRGQRDSSARIALTGYQKDITNDLALYLSNTSTQVTIRDSVFIEGKCFVPTGSIKNMANNKAATINTALIFSSPDTMPELKAMSDIIKWARAIVKTNTGNISSADSIIASFNSSTTTISGDTVTISGYLQGNVIVRANRVVFSRTASVADIIVVAGSVSFPDNFVGQLQVFAADSISIGNKATFSYPSIICLLPELSASADYARYYHYISVGDSSNISGEIYAYTKRGDMVAKITTKLRHYACFTGSIYCSGTLILSGDCQGGIISNKILNSGTQFMQVNTLQHTRLSQVPPVYSYSNLFPYQGKSKIVEWLK